MSLQAKIEEKAARIAVVGQGYVGLPLAVEFAQTGFRVTGIEADSARLAALSQETGVNRRGRSLVNSCPSEVRASRLGDRPS